MIGKITRENLWCNIFLKNGEQNLKSSCQVEQYITVFFCTHQNITFLIGAQCSCLISYVHHLLSTVSNQR